MKVAVLAIAAASVLAVASIGPASAETTIIKKYGHGHHGQHGHHGVKKVIIKGHHMHGSKKVIIHKHD